MFHASGERTAHQPVRFQSSHSVPRQATVVEGQKDSLNGTVRFIFESMVAKSGKVQARPLAHQELSLLGKAAQEFLARQVRVFTSAAARFSSAATGPVQEQ